MKKTGVTTKLLSDASAFADHWNEIAELRSQLAIEHDVQLAPLHFLASTDETRRSCSAACWRGGRLIGVMYATEHCIRGLGTGYAIGGDYSGRGLLLCAPADEHVVLKRCVRQMMAAGIHSLHLRLLPRDPGRFAVRGLSMKFLDAVIPGDLLELAPTFDQFLGSLGKHTRRNVRACTRKTEEVGIEFVPSLTREQYEAAVKRLNTQTDFPADPLRLARDERILALHGGERQALRDADGTILAVLCGFRLGDRFHLLTQLNDSRYERLSLSLVLRGYTTRYLIDIGLTQLHFVGGSSLSFGRYCQPESYRSIFIDRNKGVAAAIKRLCSNAVHLMTHMGRPVPEMLTLLCSGLLEESALSERTALRPAAMLLSQRSAA